MNYKSWQAFSKLDKYMNQIIRDNAKSFIENEKRFQKMQALSSHHKNHEHYNLKKRLISIESDIKIIKEGINNE